jgi:hypothetical protein
VWSKCQQEEITARYPGDQITDEEGEWFMGELALSQLPPGELRRLLALNLERAEPSPNGTGVCYNNLPVGHPERRLMRPVVTLWNGSFV